MQAKANGGWIHGQYRDVSDDSSVVFVHDEEKRPGVVGRYLVAHSGAGTAELIWEGEFAADGQDPDATTWEARLTELVKHRLLDRSASISYFVTAYFERNGRKIRFPSAGRDGSDITVLLPASPPPDMQAAALEVANAFERMRAGDGPGE